MGSGTDHDASTLSVRDLTVHLTEADRSAPVVDGVSFDVGDLETVGIVGESGSGKTVTALSVMGLLRPPLVPTSGEIVLVGESLSQAPKGRLQDLRGSVVSMVFQEPTTSLNPAYTIGEQIAETIRRHRNVSRRSAQEIAGKALEAVGIPRSDLGRYPWEYSGGMRQRAMIAIAVANSPKMLIADEITTALDVTIQAQILDLLGELRDQFKMSVLLVTHDLGVVASICDRVLVMYAGQIVEEAPVDDLFRDPKHPYTRGLLASVPRIGSQGERITTIPGQPPGPFEYSVGCRFAPRCPHARDICRQPFKERVLSSGLRRHLCVRAEEIEPEFKK